MTRDDEDYRDRIVQDPNIMVGKPVVRGTRIPVERVLAHLEENARADLFEAFPELTDEDVRACLAYARAAIARERAGGQQRYRAVPADDDKPPTGRTTTSHRPGGRASGTPLRCRRTAGLNHDGR